MIWVVYARVLKYNIGKERVGEVLFDLVNAEACT